MNVARPALIEMRAPGFWRDDGATARLLSPLGALYGGVARRRLAREAPRANLPAIVVGGLTAGGDGKTPLAIALARLLTSAGERPALLTRGYGRSGGGRVSFAVDLNRHDATTSATRRCCLRASRQRLSASIASPAQLWRSASAQVWSFSTTAFTAVGSRPT